MSKMWGYKTPSINNPYVYLQTLEIDPYPPSKKIFQQANDYLNVGIEQFANKKSEGIKSGLEFLQSAISSQRAHELAFIRSRIEEIKKLGPLGTEEQQICDALEDMSAQDTSIDYRLFLDGLNMVINNLEKYKTRVKAFKNTAISNIPQVRMVENLATTIGSYANTRYALYYSQEEAIRQLALKWLSEKGKDFMEEQIAQGVMGPKNVAAALALITQQIARYIYDTRKMKERHTSKADKKSKFADFHSAEEFVDFVNSIDLNAFESYSNMSSMLENDQLLEEIQQMYGIEYDKTIKANNRRLSKKASQEIQEVKALLNNEPLIDNSFKKIMNHITIEWNGHTKSQSKLALQNELVSALAPAFDSHVHLGGLNAGTDMLLGYMSATINTEEDNGEISNALQRIATRLQNEAAANSVDKTSDIYLEEMQALSDTLTGVKEGFIIHESTKNYNTLERGRWPSGMDSFSGREMNLFNYIDSIASMGEIEGIDTRWLRFIAYNLATDALGAMNKQPLETVFAIFAGIIMFDDFAVIGKEITNEMSLGNAHSLHLYRLQDMYFPASMFLDATYQALTFAKDELLEGNGFIASINKVPTINYYIDDNFTPDISYGLKFIDRWTGVKNAAEKGTSIHLHFATNFLDLMAKISSQWV